MDSIAADTARLLRQQSAIARFGSFALAESDLLKVLTEAARVCAEALSVPFCKVCRYRGETNDLLIEAGFGWNQGVPGNVVSRADGSSPQGRAFVTGLPSICNDLRTDPSLRLPAFYAEHGIISTIDVIIRGADRPYGVLEIDNNIQHDYGAQDIDFLTAFANVLSEAVATSSRVAVLQTTIEQMRVLVEEKDRLLGEKRILAEELQHRVRNNLQLVYGMLSKQLDETRDPDDRRGLRAIARRVSTLAQVYDHLLGSGVQRTTDFGAYLRSLCRSLADIHEVKAANVTLTCVADHLPLDLEKVTALGLVVTELVSNSYDHAFNGGTGTITVTIAVAPDNPQRGVLTISDNGSGFKAGVTNKRHGLGLVRRLAEQIYGEVAFASDAGTTCTVTFNVGAATPVVLP
jgi:two-component sensor histidine kinase